MKIDQVQGSALLTHKRWAETAIKKKFHFTLLQEEEASALVCLGGSDTENFKQQNRILPLIWLSL